MNTNLTIKLLRTIGSPFIAENKPVIPQNREEALRLYEYAKKNKIELLYLTSLKDQEKLKDFGLECKYYEEFKKYNEQLITAVRIAKLLNLSGVNYAIFKSIMPFPATPNDVDIIHFGTDKEYNTLIEKIRLSGEYKEIVSPRGYPYSFKHDFHDARKCEHIDLYKKDIYDIDIYHGLTVSYIRYLSEKKIKKHITKIKILNNEIKVLSPEADLVAIIAHSIITEQLLTLLVYYATLYHLTEISINDFISIVRENYVTFPVKTHLSLVAELHKAAHGFVPEKIKEMLAELGEETSERIKLLKNNLKMPYKYSLSSVIRTFLEKAREDKFRRSVVKQTVYMLNPKLAKWVIYNILWRRIRETY